MNVDNTKNILIASIYDRYNCLLDTINSLAPQLNKDDTLNLYLQNYEQIPDGFLYYLESFSFKFNIIFDYSFAENNNKGEFVDYYKEMGVFLFNNLKGYIFICDDDLIYPSNYIENTINEYNKLNCVVSYHGRVIKKLPIANYYEDSIVYPCLGEVRENTIVDVVGAGCICYKDKDNINFTKEEIKNLPKFMRDIHISKLLNNRNKTLTVLKHNKDYIKYNQKMKDKETIFDLCKNDCYEQTKIVSGFKNLFNECYSTYLDKLMPKISIVIINSRIKTEPKYVKECFDSVRNIYYSKLEVIEVENENKLLTIGKCWNDAVKKAKGDWVFFLGDDDIISPDLLTCFVANYNSFNDKDKEKIVSITSRCTIFNDEKIEKADIYHTGMWKRDYLLNNPFKEFLTKQVDSSYMAAAVAKGFLISRITYNYGLFYRIHNNQVSGRKAFSDECNAVNIDSKTMNKLKNLNME